MLTLAEELVVLSYDPDKGDRVMAPPLYNACLTAAELVELAWLGRIRLAEEAVTALDPRPTGNAGLDAALDLACTAPVPFPLYDYTRPWRALLPNHRALIRRSLLARGLLTERTRPWLVVFRARHTVATDPSMRDDLVRAVRRCIQKPGEDALRETLRAALAEVCYFSYALYAPAELRHAKEAAGALQARLCTSEDAAVGAVMRSLQQARAAHERSE